MKRFSLKKDGVAEMLNSGEMMADMVQRAQGVLAAAEASAPIGETGEYASSFRIVEDRTDRAVARVVNDAPHALIVEANTGNMAQALDAAR